MAASQNSREIGSFFQIVATAAPGRSLAGARARHRRGTAAASSTRAGDRAEIERCLAQAEAHFVFRLQTVGGFGGKSDQLNAYNVFLGDPGYFERDLARYTHATPDDLRSRGRRAGSGPDRVVLSVVPRGRPGLALRRLQPVAVS